MESDGFRITYEEERVLIFYANIVTLSYLFSGTPRDIKQFTIWSVINNSSDMDPDLRRLMNAYAKYVRPYWVHRGTTSLETVIPQPEYDEWTTWFFVNSVGSVNFKPRNVVCQAMTKFAKLDDLWLTDEAKMNRRKVEQETNVKRLINLLEISRPQDSLEKIVPIALKQRNQNYFGNSKAVADEFALNHGGIEKVEEFCDKMNLKNVKTLKRRVQNRNVKNIINRPRIRFADIQSGNEMAIIQVSQLVQSQRWPGLAILNNSLHGRALLATDVFEKGDVVLDYHGKEISMQEDDAIMENQENSRSNYLFRVQRYKVRF